MRCSNKLLKLIKNTKNNKNQLFFHEIMIPTLVDNYNYTFKIIPELKNIHYKKDYKDSDIIKNKFLLYHPIKDYDRHVKLRNQL
jgi:hypothetical protein